MQALLLAGGLGTRLQSVVNDRPKPMALIEDKPFLEYLINELKSNGITEVIFLVGYMGKMVEDYFGDGKDFGINIKYSYEQEQLGTAGAIKNADKLITDDYFFVINADTFYKIKYQNLVNLQAQKKLDITMILRRVDDVSRYGEAVLEDNMLVGFNEKEMVNRPGTINGGIYYISKKILDIIPEGKCSLENEIIPRLMKENYSLGGLVSEGYFIDIGIPEDYYRFIEDVKNSKIDFGGINGN